MGATHSVAPGRKRRQSKDEPPGFKQEPVQRRIILLGLPGVGKSSSGNTILGSKKFESDCDFDPVSTKCVSESESVDGRLLQVVDTPGFTDEVLTPEQLYDEMMKTLVEASPGPHAFVIVVRLGQISEADKTLFELLPKLFGEDASKYTMVLFTHGDGLEDQSVDDLIQSNSSMSDLVSMCGGRYCVFNNTQRGNRLQVRELLSKIDEMVEANGGEHYTSYMFRMAETFIREEKNRAAQSADRNPSVTSADRNPSGTSADRNPSGRSFVPWYRRVGERLKPYAIRTGRGWLIDAAANVAVGAAVGAVVGAGAVAVAGVGVGAGVGYVVHKSKSKSQSHESSSGDDRVRK